VCSCLLLPLVSLGLDRSSTDMMMLGPCCGYLQVLVKDDNAFDDVGFGGCDNSVFQSD